MSPVSTAAICHLAARIGAGQATAEELQLAERLLLALVEMLPKDGAIEVAATRVVTEARRRPPSRPPGHIVRPALLIGI